MGGFGGEVGLDVQRNFGEVDKAGDAEREDQAHCAGDDEARQE